MRTQSPKIAVVCGDFLIFDQHGTLGRLMYKCIKSCCMLTKQFFCTALVTPQSSILLAFSGTRCSPRTITALA